MSSSTSLLKKLMQDFDARQKCMRERKCLPPIKVNHLAVISMTVMFNNLSRNVQVRDLVGLCYPLGKIDKIFKLEDERRAIVGMQNRKSAAFVINDCQGLEYQGQNMEVAWAPNTGIINQAKWRDYWDADNGVSYIPWDILNQEINYDEFKVGGFMDEDTMPEWLKIYLSKKEKEEMLTEEETALNVSEPQEVQPSGPSGLRILKIKKIWKL